MASSSIGGETTSLAKMAIVIIFLAAAIWVALFGLSLARETVNDTVESTEKALEHGTSYVLNYANGEVQASMAEAYALFSYNQDIISECECSCTVCTHGGAPKVSTAADTCCLKTHLTGQCRVQLVSDGRGGYRMLVRDPK